MSIRRKKFELSPQLKLGVGRGHSNKILKYGSAFCLLLALGLAVNASWLMIQGNQKLLEQATPQVLGATDTKTAGSASTAEPQLIDYKVAKGDTLFNVSQKFNISWTTIATLNNLRSPFTLKLGQTLKIPQ